MNKPSKPSKPKEPPKTLTGWHKVHQQSENSELSWDELKKLVAEKVPAGILDKDIRIDIEVEHDVYGGYGYDGCTGAFAYLNIVYYGETENANYERELKKYQRALAKYDAALIKYQADIKKFKVCQEQAKQLKKRLKQLEKDGVVV